MLSAHPGPARSATDAASTRGCGSSTRVIGPSRVTGRPSWRPASPASRARPGVPVDAARARPRARAQHQPPAPAGGRRAGASAAFGRRGLASSRRPPAAAARGLQPPAHRRSRVRRCRSLPGMGSTRPSARSTHCRPGAPSAPPCSPCGATLRREATTMACIGRRKRMRRRRHRRPATARHRPSHGGWRIPPAARGSAVPAPRGPSCGCWSCGSARGRSPSKPGPAPMPPQTVS